MHLRNVLFCGSSTVENSRGPVRLLRLIQVNSLWKSLGEHSHYWSLVLKVSKEPSSSICYLEHQAIGSSSHSTGRRCISPAWKQQWAVTAGWLIPWGNQVANQDRVLMEQLSWSDINCMVINVTGNKKTVVFVYLQRYSSLKMIPSAKEISVDRTVPW